MSEITPTPEEQDANDKILAAYRAIQGLGPDGLQANNGELEQAIHVLQSFVKQHVLHRLMPEHYADWYTKFDLSDLVSSLFYQGDHDIVR